MTFLILLSVVLTLLVVETIRLVIHDGRGPQRPPASHFQDPRYQGPGTVR